MTDIKFCGLKTGRDIAAAEAAVALAIVLAMYRNFGTVHADTVQSLKR